MFFIKEVDSKLGVPKFDFFCPIDKADTYIFCKVFLEDLKNVDFIKAGCLGVEGVCLIIKSK